MYMWLYKLPLLQQRITVQAKFKSIHLHSLGDGESRKKREGEKGEERGKRKEERRREEKSGKRIEEK